MNILNLPNVMLIQIFEYLPFEEVAKKRLVCKKIDMVCQHILNCGFNKVVKQHAISLKRIKALLPRRESERRNHCLARHADILTCIETRISMLSMTYSKYMDLNLCCFIPGRVLDEIFRILRLISKTTKPLRPHEVLQELRDISSMAIEHFDEKISHSLKKSFVDTNTQLYVNSIGVGGSSVGSSSSRNVCCDQMRQKVNLLLGLGQSALDSTQISTQTRVPAATEQSSVHGENGCEEARATMRYFKKIEHEYKKGIAKMNRMMQVQTSQSRRLQQSQATVTELNMQIVELKKRIEEIDAKNRELSASIKQLNGESTAPSTPQSTAMTQEYPNTDETSDMADDATETAPILTHEDDDLTAAIKRHLDETPPDEERIATGLVEPESSKAKKAKVE